METQVQREHGGKIGPEQHRSRRFMNITKRDHTHVRVWKALAKFDES